MRIFIRIINQAAPEIRQVLAQLDQLERKERSVATAGAAMGAGLGGSTWEKFGKNLQWTGRQIEYNFTLPIVAAGAAAVKMSNDNQAAFVRIQKVYGDTSMSSKQLQSETNALRGAFLQLSNMTGISQKEILTIAGDWAAAGASGVALAKATRLSAEAMILGEMSASDTTKALIAIQAQYGLVTGEVNRNVKQLQAQAKAFKGTSFEVKSLADVVGVLNMVENQTGVSFAGLVQGFERAAGTARTAGVDVQHLAAYIAALSPAAGSAANAGNALKTIFSRLFAPTKDAADVLKQIGINTQSVTWQNKNAEDRLMTLADAYKNLNGAQKIQLDSLIGTRFQISRMSVLMDALTNKNSYYVKALQSTQNPYKVQLQYLSELNQVLRSQPNLFAILTTRIKNSLAQAIMPLIPPLLGILQMFSKWADAFANLNPAWQKFIIFGLLAVAVVGPILRYMGATILLFTELGKGLLWAAGALGIFTAETEAGVVELSGMRLALSKFGENAWTWITAGADLVWSALVKVADGAMVLGRYAVSGIQTIVAGAASTIGRVIEPVMAEAAAAMETAWAGVMYGLAVITEAGSAAMAAIWAELGNTWAILTGMIGAEGMKVWEVVQTAWVQLTTVTSRVLTTLWESTQAALLVITESGGAAITTVWEALSGGLLAIWEAMSGWLVRLWTTTQLELARITNLGSVLDIAAAGLGKLRALFMAFAGGLSEIMAGIGGILLSPWTLAIIAVIGLIVAFRKQIGQIFSDIAHMVISAFNALPQGVQNAFMAVIEVVKAAVSAVRQWMSELNPFKRHSPSIVDHVQAGTAVIGQHYSNMSDHVTNTVNGASDALQGFKSATQGASTNFDNASLAKQRQDVVKAAPSAGPAFDQLAAAMKRAQALMPGLEAQIQQQTKVTNAWKVQLDAANRTLQIAQDRLNELQKVAQRANDTLSADKDILNNLTNTPIQGMKKYTDAIFANDQAQKQLQLQMMKLQDQVGVVGNLTDAYAKLQGQVESLQGERDALRSAGAGSDVLKTYDDQLAAIKKQQSSLQGASNQYADMQKQLDALTHTGQELALEQSVTFDPLTKQISDLTNAMTEVPFDQLIAKIRTQQDLVTRDQAVYDQANAAVKQQQMVVDALTDSRDRLNDAYDIENNKLSALTDQYNALKQVVSDAQSAMDDFTQKASKAAGGGLDQQLQNFQAASAAGGFDTPGGMAQIGREGGLGDQTDQINKLADDWKKQSESMFGSLDMLGPFKQMWHSLEKWIDDHTGGLATKITTGIRDNLKASLVGAGLGALIGELILGPFGAILGAGLGAVVGSSFHKINWKGVGDSVHRGLGPLEPLGRGIKSAWEPVGKIFSTVGHWISEVWKLLGPSIIQIFDKIGHGLVQMFQPLIKEFPQLKKSFEDIWTRLTTVFKTLKPLVKPLMAALGAMFLPLLLAANIVVHVLADTLGPIFKLLGDAIANSVRLWTDVIQLFLDLITGHWGKAWHDILDIFTVIGKQIGDLFSGTFGVLWGLVKGIVQGIVGFFKWLYDILLGHSIIPDIINGIMFWWHALEAIVKWIFDHIIQPIFNAFAWFWNAMLKPLLGDIGRGFENMWHGLVSVIKWIGDNIITPIGNAFSWLWNAMLKPVLNSLVSGMATIWNGVGHAIASGVNIGIDAIDALIHGINWILGHVPGLHGVKIGDIGHVGWKDFSPPHLARGDQLASTVGAGFKTNGIRAIVGEGNPMHPEYVIPTDPAHRSNAEKLLRKLQKDLGVPAYGLGGIVGSVIHGAEAGADGVIHAGEKAVGYIRKGLVTAAMAPFLKGFDMLNAYSPNSPYPVHDWLNSQKNDIYNWMKGADKKDYGPGFTDLNLAPTTMVGVERWAPVIKTVLAMLHQNVNDRLVQAVESLIQFESGGNEHAINLSDSNYLAGHPSMGLAQTIMSTFESYRSSALPDDIWNGAANLYAGLNYGIHRYGSILGIPGIAAVMKGKPYIGYAGGGVLPSIYKAAKGAYVKATNTGSFVHVGEGGHDEAIVPLPKNFKPGDGGSTYNFYGDLNFPNVKDGSDAEDFLKNLKSLAGQ